MVNGNEVGVSMRPVACAKWFATPGCQKRNERQQSVAAVERSRALLTTLSARRRRKL
jgi:hypothetical protein